MGVSQNIYIGAFIWYTKKSVEKSYTEIVCPKGHSIKYHDKFCAKCGSKTTEKVDKEKMPYNFVDWLEEGHREHEDALIVANSEGQDNYDILIANEADHFIDGDDLVEVIDSDLIEEEIAKFAKKYQKLIKELSVTFDDLQVRYGVVVWWC